MNRLEELSLRFVDAELADAEIQELAELVTSSDKNRDAFVRIMELESHLLSSGRASQAENVVASLESERAARVENSVMSAIAGPRTKTVVEEVKSHTPWSSLPQALRITVLAVAVTAIATCVLLFVQPGNIADGETEVARLNAHGSSVVIKRADGSRIETDANSDDSGRLVALSVGEAVALRDSMDSAQIIYSDGTTIMLLGKTELELSDYGKNGKKLLVRSGVIQADVSEQPTDTPLQIITPTATLEVLGTTLGVEVDTIATQLEVSSGIVAMTRIVDGKRVDVTEGTFARATASVDEALQAAALPELPGRWSQDFSRGLPLGWQAGTLVERHGHNAVLSVPDRHAKDTEFAVTTHNAWREGQHALFRVHEDSVLHVRFRQDEFARIRLLVVTRVFPAGKGRAGANLFYTRKAWNESVPAGQWHTFSVPLADVDWFTQKREQQKGDPDLTDLAAFMIQVATTRDVGLAIDRIWVTRRDTKVETAGEHF